MKDKITRNFLQTAHDVLSGRTDVVSSFQEQADEILFEMWLNDEIQLEDETLDEIADLYEQFENNEITEKQLEEGMLSKLRKVGSAVKKVGSVAGKVAGKTAKVAGKVAAKGA